MQFTKTLTFDKVLTDALSTQERILDCFQDIPILSVKTKVKFSTQQWLW